MISNVLGALDVVRREESAPYKTAEWLLAGLGAHRRDGGDASTAALTLGEGGVRLVGRETVPDAVHGGLPAGTFDYLCGVALATAAVASRLGGGGAQIAVSAPAVAAQLWLPEVMGEAYGAPRADRIRPRPPRPAPGGPGRGWYHADLGSPGDAESFDLLLSTLPADADAETVAAAAQEWRLPVCPYRRRPAAGAAETVFPITSAAADFAPAPAAAPGPSDHGSALSGVTVLDLTAMWAGPLATWLLQGLGATIDKVEPQVRPDGFRASHGGGIYPGGHQSDPGRDSAMWNALNHGKSDVQLDLRDERDRERYRELACTHDIVIDSFSPRVMTNFGLDDAPAGRVRITMPAFPTGPNRSWVAYGTGAHAILGLGDQGDGAMKEPGVSYPDPLAGFTAALAAVTALSTPIASRLEVTLAGASQPLLALAATAEAPTPPRDAQVGAAILKAAIGAGVMEAWTVAGQTLLHPRPPWVPSA